MIVTGTGGWEPNKVHVKATFVIEAVPVSEFEHDQMKGLPEDALISVQNVEFKGGALHITVEADRGPLAAQRAPVPTVEETLAQLEGDVQAS